MPDSQQSFKPTSTVNRELDNSLSINRVDAINEDFTPVISLIRVMSPYFRPGIGPRGVNIRHTCAIKSGTFYQGRAVLYGRFW
jgi:hypothetical protein